MRRRFAITGAAISVLLAACSTAIDAPKAPVAATPEDSSVRLVAPDGRTITVHAQFARTPAEQQRGLMERTSLAPDSGMLFVFPQEQILSFWMKDTLIPLDILFFDGAGKFVSATGMQPCVVPEGEQCPIFTSVGAARYALEVPTGSIRDFGGVGVGWSLKLEGWAFP